jgi:hypothetical protein
MEYWDYGSIVYDVTNELWITYKSTCLLLLLLLRGATDSKMLKIPGKTT